MRARSIFMAITMAVAIGTFSVSTAAVAQDLLPRDNGIFNYHRPPRYRESESHPLRTLAYLVHPGGWLLREVVYRPWSAFAASTKFTRSFFGYREPFDFRETICYHDAGEIPDCREVSPYTKIGGTYAGDGGDDLGSMMQEERQVFFPDVNFEFDKANLTGLGKGRVRQIAQLLASVPSLEVVVEGHADNRGTDGYNSSLGNRRAKTVISELIELGIDPARLSPISLGETRPIFSENEEWAHAVNRRVQFTAQGEGSVEVPAAEVTEEAAQGS